MTVEDRLAKIKSALEDEMNYIYDMLVEKPAIDVIKDPIKSVLQDTIAKWTLCLDPENVIDMNGLEQWKSKVESL
jgi:hypothetical protein